MVFPGAPGGLRYTEWVHGETDGSVARDVALTVTENGLTFAGASTLTKKWVDSEREARAIMRAARTSPKHTSAFLAQVGKSRDML